VPFEDLAASIDGAVNRPGRYELIGSRDLAELLELAGGLAPTSTRLLPVSLVRRLPDDRQDQKLLDFTPEGKLPTVAIQHEDGVRIPSFTELQRSVMVIGAVAGAAPAVAVPTGGKADATAPDEVSATRRLPFVQGDSVRTLLERVGGVGPLANLEGSYLIRDGKSLPVDLHALVILRDLTADRPIALGDTLVVPFKRRNILVEGAVFSPGAYPYNPAHGIEHYLALAGGLNRFAKSLSNVRVVEPNGTMIDYHPDLQLEPGSSVVVPERNFSRAEVVQILISIAGVVVSGTAVMIAARR
jgi:protein involved in polysaccharide export with SLBB domain